MSFLRRRMESYLTHAKKGRTLRNIGPEAKPLFEKSLQKEWNKWVKYDAVRVADGDELANIYTKDMLPHAYCQHRQE